MDNAVLNIRLRIHRLDRLCKASQIIRAGDQDIPALLNTSFNIAGKPIVESPDDAIQRFKDTNLGCLAIGKFLIIKNEATPKIVPNEFERFVISLGEELI